MFNYYLNQLIVDLERIVVKVYAYADDLLVICKDIRSTKKVIRLFEKWSEKFDMMLNKKKCGVLFYN